MSGQAFSPLRSLGYTVFGGSHDPNDCWFVIYKAYYDASGSQTDPTTGATQALVVVGVAATEAKWLAFESEWDGLLDDFDLDSFRTVDYVNSRGQFSGWKGRPGRRKRFMERAVQIIKRRTNKSFGCATLLSDYEAVDRDYELSESYGVGHPRAGAYAACAGLCHARVEDWMRRKKPSRPIAHVFERGDEGQGAFLEQLRHREDVLGTVDFRDKTDRATGQPFRQFEAADLIAWNFRNGYREYSAEDRPPPSPSLVAIIKKLPVEEGCFDEGGLRGFCEKMHAAGLMSKRSGGRP